MSRFNSRTHEGTNSTNQNLDRGSRFIPVSSHPQVYRNDTINNLTDSQNAAYEGTPPASSSWISLNDGMLYLRSESERGRNIDYSSANSEDNKESARTSPSSPHQAIIADLLGVSTHNRVYKLSTKARTDLALDYTNANTEERITSIDISSTLSLSPSSKRARKYLASRSNSTQCTPKKKPKTISKPEHNLEAPGLKDDFYCNVISWSSMTNRIAVGLNNSVYSWSTDNDVMYMYHDPNASITALEYSNGDYILIGRDNGYIALLSQLQNTLKAVFDHQKQAVFCFAWLPDSKSFFAGDSNGDVLYFKIIERNYNVQLDLITKLKCHQQQICGIHMNQSYTLMTVGGNDNSCSVWDISNLESIELKCILPHKAAVKAIAFCPWANTMLATGGGSSDRTIRIWHASTGTLLSSHVAHAQITGLFWCKNKRELIATFGYSNLDKPMFLTVYSYPDMNPTLEVASNAFVRCLSACQSPDGTYICLASSDAFVRIYKIWDENANTALSSVAQTVGIYGSSLIEMYEGITKTDIIR